MARKIAAGSRRRGTAPQDLRPEWLADDTQALVGLAAARNDGLLMPAESVRNVAVAALNPPGVEPSLAFAPGRYSRRGPGLRSGVKPDLACVGGCGSLNSPLGHGLFSLRADGVVEDSCGTSFATPIAAKTAAVLEHSIEGTVSRETLIGLMVHHAQVPALLRTKALSGVARHLVGFGMPPSAQEILAGSDYQITLVFASRLRGISRSRSTSCGRLRLWARTALVGEPRSSRSSQHRRLIRALAPNSCV